MSVVVTAAQMRELDRLTIEDLGIPGAVLMENAGRAVADEAGKLGAPIAILCGSGNNGGDGFVAARWLRERGVDVRVALVAGRPRTPGDAALHLAAYERSGGALTDVDAALHGAAVVVDAIFGTGLSRPLDETMGQLIERINRHPGARLAVDVPSGMHSDLGVPLGAAVRADVTVTFAFAKRGLVSSPGHELAGRLVVAPIGIPASLLPRVGPTLELLDDVRRLRPARPGGGHKGTFGHVLVVAGSPGKAGAGLLAARAALRTGAGLCTLGVPSALQASLEGRVPEVMLAAIDTPAELRRFAEGKKGVAIGPGVPTDDSGAALVDAVLGLERTGIVVDADGLNHLAGRVESVAAARSPVVLTPHPGEAARLLGSEVKTIQDYRVGAAGQLAERAGAVVVLKGARTVIAAPDGRRAINPTGNPGLGTGGTGDVLTGVIVSLLSQGLDAFDAACLGVYLHGHAGDRVAAAIGAPAGLLAGDLVDELPRALASL